jgi:hypothetical protein
MKNFIKNYVSIPFIKGSLISISVILILMYVILPGLTIDNTILNILSFILLCVGSMAITLGVTNYIKNQINKLK